MARRLKLPPGPVDPRWVHELYRRGTPPTPAQARAIADEANRRVRVARDAARDEDEERHRALLMAMDRGDWLAAGDLWRARQAEMLRRAETSGLIPPRANPADVDALRKFRSGRRPGVLDALDRVLLDILGDDSRLSAERVLKALRERKDVQVTKRAVHRIRRLRGGRRPARGLALHVEWRDGRGKKRKTAWRGIQGRRLARLRRLMRDQD